MPAPSQGARAPPDAVGVNVETRSSAQGNCSAKSLAGNVIDSSLSSLSSTSHANIYSSSPSSSANRKGVQVGGVQAGGGSRQGVQAGGSRLGAGDISSTLPYILHYHMVLALKGLHTMSPQLEDEIHSIQTLAHRPGPIHTQNWIRQKAPLAPDFKVEVARPRGGGGAGAWGRGGRRWGAGCGGGRGPLHPWARNGRRGAPPVPGHPPPGGGSLHL